MQFEKYHGLGNDFVIVSHEDVAGVELSQLALNVCDRKTGVGADGFIVSSLKGEIPEMIFYNADGSYDTMCGNGFRCLCLYLKNNKVIKERKFSIKTGAGVLEAEVVGEDPFLVKVALGKAEYTHPTIGEELRDREIVVGDRKFNLSAAFVGTPHAVVFSDDLSDEFIDKYGPLINDLPYFPEGTSVNFCRVEGESAMRIVTWERGVGRTMACGTGSCASATIGKNLGKVSGENIVVKHALGELIIETGEEIYMTGGGVKVASGYLE